jgi:hypothetical protein
MVRLAHLERLQLLLGLHTLHGEHEPDVRLRAGKELMLGNLLLMGPGVVKKRIGGLGALCGGDMSVDQVGDGHGERGAEFWEGKKCGEEEQALSGSAEL